MIWLDGNAQHLADRPLFAPGIEVRTKVWQGAMTKPDEPSADEGDEYERRLSAQRIGQ